MTSPITSLSLSPTSSLLALATPESLLFSTPPSPQKLSSPPTPLQPQTSHPFPNISSLTLPSPDTLYTVTTRGSLIRYQIFANSPTEKFSITAAHSTHPLTSVAALSPTSLIATAAKDGLIKLWDPETATSVAKLAAHRYEVRSVSLASSFDDETPVTLIASAGRDKTVRLWDSRTDQPIAVLTGHSGWVHSVALASNPSPIAVSCGGDKTVRVWDLLTMRERVTFTGHEYRVWDVAVPENAKFCVSASTDATVRAWEIDADGRHIFDAHNDSVLCVAAARDARFIVSGCEDGSVLVWGCNGLFGMKLPEEQLVDVGTHVGKSFDEVPKQMDTTPLVPVDDDIGMNVAKTTEVVEDVLSMPAETVVDAKPKEPVKQEKTEPLKVAIAVPPEQTPSYDKSAAELVRALQRIGELEKLLQEANDAAAVKDRELSALKASLVERDATITKLTAEVETSKALVREAGVRALLDSNPRKADVALDYDEPVNKIGAVSDKLTRLAARLDAMIATN